MRVARQLLGLCALVVMTALPGCPAPVQPPTPDGGRACLTDDDCNPVGTTCGPITLCVQALCEAEPSRYVPCR